MIPLKLLQRLGRTFGLPRQGRRDTHASTSPCRPHLEALEDRCVPSSGAPGVPFQVNDPTFPGIQATSKLGSGSDTTVQAAAYTSAGWVIVWSGNGPGDDVGIFARRYDGNGNSVGESLVNRNTAGSQVSPVVASAPGAGTYAVVWNSDWSIDGRLYRAVDGAPIAEFRVAAADAKTGYAPAGLAMDATGNFVVLYHQYITRNRFGGINSWMVQRYNAAGQAQGIPIKVAQPELLNAADAGVAMDPQGNFVVTWADTQIYAQRYSAKGKAVGGTILVTSGQSPPPTYLAGLGPNVAMDAQGDFLVTYGVPHPNSPTYWDRACQWFSASGVPQGQPLTVADPNWTERAVAMQANGDFVLTWSNAGADVPGVYAQSFYANGTPKEAPLLVSQDAANYPNETDVLPSVAIDPNGNFLVVWNHVKADNSDSDVFACYVDPRTHGRSGNQPRAFAPGEFVSSTPSVQEAAGATNPTHLVALDTANGGSPQAAGVAVPVLGPTDQIDWLFTLLGATRREQRPF